MPESLHKNCGYDDIRPYFDEEVNAVLRKLLPDIYFKKFVNYLFPEWKENAVESLLSEVDSINEFQEKLMYPAAEAIVKKTISEASHSGMDFLNKENNYVFISNHRDIILDSALLNLMLFKQGLDTSEVAIGSNLLIQPWIKDLVRLNKNFIVHRNIPSKLLYDYSLRLSNYIREGIKEKRASVWIAQKEGRTKDGNDLTQAGLLKMLSISGAPDLIDSLKPLNMVPMAISYEYEPCDYLKARELYIASRDGEYTKTPEDDLKSMFFGVTSYKGRVHIAMGKPLNNVLERLEEKGSRNDQLKALAQLIDKQIYAQYKLWPSNFVAADILNKNQQFEKYYSNDDKNSFLLHLDEAASKVEEPTEEIIKLMMKIYANPVANKFQDK